MARGGARTSACRVRSLGRDEGAFQVLAAGGDANRRGLFVCGGQTPTPPFPLQNLNELGHGWNPLAGPKDTQILFSEIILACFFLAHTLF